MQADRRVSFGGFSLDLTTEHLLIGPAQVPIACELFGVPREGIGSLASGAFQRLGMSPVCRRIIGSRVTSFTQV